MPIVQWGGKVKYKAEDVTIVLEEFEVSGRDLLSEIFNVFVQIAWNEINRNDPGSSAVMTAIHELDDTSLRNVLLKLHPEEKSDLLEIHRIVRSLQPIENNCLRRGITITAIVALLITMIWVGHKLEKYLLLEVGQ